MPSCGIVHWHVVNWRLEHEGETVSNIDKARRAIEAEISHARKGLAFYEQRVGSLQAMLASLGYPGGSDGGGRKAAPAEAAKPGKHGRPRKLAPTPKALPRTGGEFWSGLVAQAPQFGPDILAAAIAKLGFEPTAEQRKALGNRMAPALAALVKSGKIADSGKGRLHRYFKP